MTRPVGYLVSGYPAVSHTFVLREVQALRRAGVEVQTYSVHEPRAADLLSTDDRREAASTTFLRPVRPAFLLRVVLGTVLRHPGPLLRVVRQGVARGRRARGKLWQVFYVAEALLLAAYCRRDGVRHLHAHFANNAADVARAVASYGCAVDGPGSWSWSFTMHGPTEFARPAEFGLAAKARDAAFVACISDYCRSELARLAGVAPPGRRPLVRCGLDVSRVPEIPVRSGAGPLRVLCVGRLVQEKGQDLLLRAVRDLRDAGIAVELTLVGDGPARPGLQDAVVGLGLVDAVTMTGAVGQDEMGSWYAWADVFVLISHAEGLPVVLMEAMSTGLPVVTTRIAGIPELVEHDVTGLLVDAGDVPAAVQALAGLADDVDRRRRLGERGRVRVLEQHDVDRCVVPLRDAFRTWAAP